MGWLSFTRKRKIESTVEDVRQYVSSEFVSEKPKDSQESGIHYSLSVEPEERIQYSDRYNRLEADAAIAKAIYGAEGSHPAIKVDDTFSEKVREIINRKELTESKVYKAALVDRRLFSKIMTERSYKPSFDTAVALALALKLNREESADLLKRAGYALSHSNERDIIIEYFFRNGIYSLNDVNIILEKMEQKPLGR